ncbi:MAG: helix-turn-helix domain-containing protein [Eubacteriales bacterium]|nr:helix-turn-helix domain-containing protein [Eubacteriales bacterium]
MEIKELTTEEEFDVFINPMRQRILRAMSVEGGPMTAKMLADRLRITPSSAKHHLLRLEGIGLVAVHHTETIHGIVATFYGLLPVEVRLGLDKSAFREEKDAISQNLLMSLYGDFMKRAHEGNPADGHFHGDLRTGALWLTREEADALAETVTRYVREHEQPRENALPFEFAALLLEGERHEKR